MEAYGDIWRNALIYINDISNYDKVSSPFEFLVDVDLITTGSIQSYGIGIGNGSDRYYFFLANGYFKFTRYNFGWNPIIDWSVDINITSDGQMRILHKNSKLSIYLNNHMLASIDLQLSTIDRLYLYSQSNQSVEFDNLELYGILTN